MSHPMGWICEHLIRAAEVDDIRHLQGLHGKQCRMTIAAECGLLRSAPLLREQTHSKLRNELNSVIADWMAWLSGRGNHRLGFNDSNNGPKRGRSPRMWARMISNLQLTHATGDWWQYDQCEFSIVKVKEGVKSADVDFYGKIDVPQEHSPARTNLDETVSVVDPIG